MVLMPLLSRLLTLLVILTMPLFLARLTLIPIKSLSRSEERFSRNAETDLVCRLLLEKKKFDDDGERLIVLINHLIDSSHPVGLSYDKFQAGQANFRRSNAL